MKHLVLSAAFAAIVLAQHPKVSECFKVRELLRADQEHYWATWSNSCPYTIDSVYVKVGFADRASREVANGVWSLHFVAPGAHRTMRLSAPGTLADFASVHQKKITADMGEAFGKPAQPSLSPVEMAAVSAYRQAVAKDGSEKPLVRTVAPVVVGDPGEGAYQYQRTPVIPEAADIIAEAAFRQLLTTVAILAPLEVNLPSASDLGEASFRTDFPDAWQAVLSPQEVSVSSAPRASFVRFVSDEKPLFW